MHRIETVKSLAEMLGKSEESIRMAFCRARKSPSSLPDVVDYVNGKGKFTKPKEKP